MKFVTRVLYAREVEREVHYKKKKIKKQNKVIRTTMQDTRAKIPQHRRAASKIILTKVHPLCFNGHYHLFKKSSMLQFESASTPNVAQRPMLT